MNKLARLYITAFFIAVIAISPGVLFLYQPDDPVGSAASELGSHYQDRVTAHRVIEATVLPGAVVFIGDEFIEALDADAITPRAINYGISGDTTFGVLQRLANYASLQTAACVVLSIGINDLPLRSNEDIATNTRLILEALPPETPVIVSHILTGDHDGAPRRMRVLNRKLSRLITGYANASHVDTWQGLMDENGRLKADYHIGDGIHLNEPGYETWAGALSEAVALHCPS